MLGFVHHSLLPSDVFDAKYGRQLVAVNCVVRCIVLYPVMFCFKQCPHRILYIMSFSHSSQISPVVHQLDHFQAELIGIADTLISTPNSPFTYSVSDVKDRTGKNRGDVDRAWQAIKVSRCLFDCKDSVDFTKSVVSVV